MKKTIPFKRTFEFKTNISEIVSISLDNDLKLNDRLVLGNLVISGSYKMNDASVNVEEFKFEIPVKIEMNKQYELNKMTIEINDFYYEIIDDNKLEVNIEILLDNIEEVLFPFKEEEKIEQVNKEIETKEIETKERETSLFDTLDEEENYAIYRVCILKENETIENILLKYKVTKELLEQYNDLSDLKVGNKIIIPQLNENK